MKPCERCGVKPKGEYGLHGYCEDCSEDLCEKCMDETKCRASTDGKHHEAEE